MTTCIDIWGGPPTGARIDAARGTASHPLWLLMARAWAAARQAMALLGVTTLAGIVLLAAQPQLRAELERGMADWLLNRQATLAPEDDEPASAERVLATDLKELPLEQARVAHWLARKYRVASEPIGALVAEAYRLGPQLRLDPALILAVMAIESRFNPFAASPMGAHGLMQVHTRVHADKFEGLGGTLATFDPLSNLRVGAEILQEAVRRAGSIPGGLRLYVGAVTIDGRDHIVKVLSEYERLKRVFSGQQVGFQAAVPLPAAIDPVAPAPPGEPTAPSPAQLEAEATLRAAGSQAGS
ncbi:MAG: transglycosylase SLT domain-containing protein [Tepidimonas sp.]|uniref:transglycosylase SLT domain-containing protein n=1 Tax=Tepidimonas sp. TaxID=2002775 RepID=UPI00405518F8